MKKHLTDPITALPRRLKNSLRTKIRKRAIEQAKVTIILAQKDINTFSEEELEIIIADEERKIHDKIKSMTLMGVLAFLGISLF